MTRYDLPLFVFYVAFSIVNGFSVTQMKQLYNVEHNIFSPKLYMTQRRSLHNNRLYLSGNGDNNLSQQEREEKLSQLGFTESKTLDDIPEDVNVNVNLIDDVDPVTITALGFAAIAANFLIFANMGDGGK